MLRAFLPGLLAVAIAASALAQSQRQSPRTPPSGQNTQPTASDQRGTDQVPLTVKILPAEAAQKDAEKAETEKTEKAAIDKRLAFDTRRLADYTWNLAAVTALLFLVAVVQAGMFVWQLLLLRRGAHDATVAANAARIAADAAVEQSKLMGLQLDLVEKQHGVARHQFFAVNRPRLIVHFIKRVIEHPELPVDEQAFAAEFRVMNFGTSTAWVTGSRIALARFIPGQWPLPEDLIGDDLITRDVENKRRFMVGATDKYTARSEMTEGLIERMAIQTEDRLIQALDDIGVGARGRLYLIGCIVYEDALENPITMYFCREFSRETGRFTPARNCDWEEAYD
jgi:hypothetical protein